MDPHSPDFHALPAETECTRASNTSSIIYLSRIRSDGFGFGLFRTQTCQFEEGAIGELPNVNWRKMQRCEADSAVQDFKYVTPCEIFTCSV